MPIDTQAERAICEKLLSQIGIVLDRDDYDMHDQIFTSLCTNYPAALDEIDRLRAELERLKAALGQFDEYKLIGGVITKLNYIGDVCEYVKTKEDADSLWQSILDDPNMEWGEYQVVYTIKRFEGELEKASEAVSEALAHE